MHVARIRRQHGVQRVGQVLHRREEDYSNPLGDYSNPLGVYSNPLGDYSNPLGVYSNPLGVYSNPQDAPVTVTTRA